MRRYVVFCVYLNDGFRFESEVIEAEEYQNALQSMLVDYQQINDFSNAPNLFSQTHAWIEWVRTEHGVVINCWQVPDDWGPAS